MPGDLNGRSLGAHRRLHPSHACITVGGSGTSCTSRLPSCSELPIPPPTREDCRVMLPICTSPEQMVGTSNTFHSEIHAIEPKSRERMRAKRSATAVRLAKTSSGTTRVSRFAARPDTCPLL